MPKNGLFLTPVPNYLKNVSKSIAFSTADTLGNIAPNIKDFSETNGDFIKNSYGFLKNPPAQIRKGIDAFRESKIYEALDAGVKNTLEDLRTGNFYNKARDDQYAAEAGGFGDDDDFDFDFDMDDDSTESKLDTEEPTAGDKAIVKEIASSNAASTSATVTAIVSTNDRSVSQMRMSTSQLYQQNERLFGGVLNNLATTNATITALFNLTGEALKSIDTNSSKFYTESLKLDTERNAMLKEILEIQRNTYKSAAAKEEEAKKAGKEIYDYEKVASGGILDIGEYTKAIIKNVNDQLESAGAGMLKAFGDPATLIKTFFSSPLKGVSDVIANTLIAPTIKRAMGDLDDIMGSIAGQIFGRLDNAKSKDGLMGWMGKIFGLNSTIKEGYDTSKYEKGAVPFDGITRKAIIDVIPGYLRKIESHLSGSEERIFDYNTGKWTNANAVKQSYNNIKKSVISRSSAVLNEDAGFKRMKKAVYDGAGGNKATKAEYDAFFEQLNDYLYENNGIFNPLESAARNGITSSSYPLLAKNYYLLQQIFAGTGRAAHLKLAGSIQSNKNNLRKQYEAQQNIIGNVYGNMFDGSDMNSHIKVTKKGKVVGATSNLLLSSRDEQHNNVFDYLRNQLVELKKHTELLSEQLLHGGSGYSGNGRGSTGSAITKESIANKINGIGVGQLNSISFRDPEDNRENGQKITKLELIELLKSNPYIIAQELGEYIEDEEDENGDPILVQEARDRLNAIIKDREAFEKLDRVQRAAGISNGDLFDFAGIKAEDMDDIAKSLEILKDMNDARAKKMTYEEYVEKKREKEDKKNRGLDDDEEVKGPAGFKAFMKRLYAIRNKASDPIVKMADTLGTSIYDIFYQAPVKDEDGNLIEGGIIGSITNRLKNTFTTIKDNFSKNFIDPLRDKYDLDDFEDRYTGTLSKLAGGAYSYLIKDSIDDLFKRFKDSEGIDLSGNKKYVKKGQNASIAREYRSAKDQEEYLLKEKSDALAILRDPNQTKEAKDKAQEKIDHIDELLEFAKNDRRLSSYQSKMNSDLKDLKSMNKFMEAENKKAPEDRDQKKIEEMSQKALTSILKTRTPEEVLEAASKAQEIYDHIEWLKEKLKGYEDALTDARKDLTRDLSKEEKAAKEQEIADLTKRISNTSAAINNAIKESEVLYNLYLTFKNLGYYDENKDNIRDTESFKLAELNADMGDYNDGNSMYKLANELTKHQDKIIDDESKKAFEEAKKNAKTDEDKAKFQKQIDALEKSAKRRQSDSDLNVKVLNSNNYDRLEEALYREEYKLDTINKTIADYRGDKNSDEYKALLKNRDGYIATIKSIKNQLGITIETSAKGKGRFAGITSLSAGETIYNARGKYKVPSTGIYRITEPSTIIPSGRGVRQDEAAERLKIKQAGGIPMHADGTEESSESSSEEESVVIKKDKKGLMKMIDGFLAPKSSDGEVMGEVKDKLRTKMPEILAHGTIGGVLGLLLGMPVLGAGLGAATGVITNSEKLQDMILGKKDSNGERAGGLISKKVQDAAKKWLPDMAKGGALGAIAGLVTPFGPVGGLMIGAGLGLLKNTKDFQTKFYGDDSSLKITDKQKESMLKILKAAGIGAGAGLLSSLLLPTPFGIMGNAVMGTAIGLMSTNEEFKERLFGFKDNKGVRHGGLISDLADGTSELKKTFIDIADELKNTVLNKILDPLARFVEPAIHEIPRLVAWLPLKILGVVDNWFGDPLKTISGFITGIANKGLKAGGWLFNKTLGAAADLITEPLGRVGDRLKMNQINRNDASRFSGDARVKSQIDFIKDKYKGDDVKNAITAFEEAKTPDERLNAANEINSLVKEKDRINISDIAVTNIKSKNSVQSLKELGNVFLDVGSNSADVMKGRKRARNDLKKKLRAWKNADNKPLNPQDIDRILEAVDAGKDNETIMNGIKNARIKGSKTAMTDEEFRNFATEYGFNNSLSDYRAKMTSYDKISNGATLDDLINEYDKALPGMGNYLKSLNLDLSKPEDRAQLTKMAKKFFDQANYLDIYGDHSDDELHTGDVKDALNRLLDSITNKGEEGEETVFDKQNEVLNSILDKLTEFKEEVVGDFADELFGETERAGQIAQGIKNGKIDLGNRRAYTSAKKDENGEFILDENGNKIYEFNRDGMIADVKSKFDEARFDGDKELFSGLSDEEAASIVDNLDLYDAQTAARKYGAVGVGKDFLRFNGKKIKAVGKGSVGAVVLTTKGAIGVGKFGYKATKFGVHAATAPVRGGAHLVADIAREADLSSQVPKKFKDAINKYKFADFVHPGMINRSNFQAYCKLFELGYAFDASGIRYINECMQRSKGTYKKLKSILMDKNIVKMLAKGKSDKKNFTLTREYLEYLMNNSSSLKDKADILVRRKLSAPSANAFLYDDLTENPSLDTKNAMEAAANSEAESNDDASASVEQVSNNGVVDGTVIESHASGTEGGDIDENKKSFFRVIGDSVIPFKKTAKGWAIDETNPVAKAYKNAKAFKEKSADKLHNAQLKASHAVSSVFNVLKKPVKLFKWFKWLVIGGVLLKSGILGQIFDGIIKPIWTNTIYPWVKDTALPWLEEKVPLAIEALTDGIVTIIPKIASGIWDGFIKSGILSTILGKSADALLGGGKSHDNNEGGSTTWDPNDPNIDPAADSYLYDESGKRLTNAEAKEIAANGGYLRNEQGAVASYDESGNVIFKDTSVPGARSGLLWANGAAHALAGASTPMFLKGVGKVSGFIGKHGGLAGKLASKAFNTAYIKPLTYLSEKKAGGVIKDITTNASNIKNGIINAAEVGRYHLTNTVPDTYTKIAKYVNPNSIRYTDTGKAYADDILTKTAKNIKSKAVGENGAFATIASKLKGLVDDIFKSRFVAETLPKIAEFLKLKDLMKWLNNVKDKILKVLNSSINKAKSSAAGKATSKIGKGAAKAAKKLMEKINIAMYVYDFTSGMDQAEAILGVSDTDILEEFICGIVRLISNITIIFSIIPGESWIAQNILKLLGTDIEERQKESTAEFEAWKDTDEGSKSTLSESEWRKKKKSVTGWLSVSVGQKVNSWWNNFKSKFSKNNTEEAPVESGYGRGKFAKQTDPSVAKMRFNATADSEYQTIGDSGCGPVAAVNAASVFGRGKSDIMNAANMALNGGYKETNGGTDPNFFNEYFASKGLGSSGIVSDKNELYSNIVNGNPTVLMGKDNNGVSSRTPFGRTSHYVTALGTTNDGLIKVTDPEGGDMLYNPNDLLDKTTLGVSAFGRGKFNFKKLMGKDDPFAAAEEIRSKGNKYGKGPEDDSQTANDIATDFTRYQLTDSQLKQLANAMLSEQAGVEGVMSEASMAANLLETSRWSKYNGDIVKMMQNDGWFASVTRSKAHSTSNPGDKYVNAVKSVLVDGNRVFPLNVNEHDCFSDISYASNSGNTISDIKNRDNYQKNLTYIKNRYGAEYTFYDWAQPSEKKGDPFGYTMTLEQARAKKKKFGLPVGSGDYIDLRASADSNGISSSSSNQPTNAVTAAINGFASFIDGILGTQTAQAATTDNGSSDPTATNGSVTPTGADGSADKLITTAVAEEGYKESGDNNTKYGAWNGVNNAPWCASFVSWSANQAGIPTSIIPKTALVADLLSFYNKNGGVHHGDEAKPGDILIQKDSSHSHTGIVTGVDGNNVYTVEGNSSDKVARRAYKKSDSVNRYGTPNFAQPATVNLSNTASVGTAASFSDTRGGNKNKPASKYGSFLNNARYGKGNSISVKNISRDKNYEGDAEYNDVPENMRGGKGTGVYEAVRNFIDSKGRTTEDNSTSKLLKTIIAILTTIADNTEKLNAILDFLNDTLGVALTANDVTNIDQNSLKAKLRAAMSGDINSSLDAYTSTMSDSSMARIMNIMTSIASA